jgi:HAD superfamily hydrolase (TIGR01509 family)
MIRTIFFDIDNTLIEKQPKRVVTTLTLLSRFLKDLPSYDQISSAIFDSVNNFYLVSGLSYLNDKEVHLWQAVAKRMLITLGISLDSPSLDKISKLIGKKWQTQEFYLYSDVIPTLTQLKKYNISLIAITGRIHNNEEELKKVGIRSFFDHYLFSGLLNCYKPNILFYQKALDLTRVNSAEALLVDDETMVVEGAHLLGITPTIIDRQRKFAPGEFIRICNLEDLLPLIKWYNDSKKGGIAK